MSRCTRFEDEGILRIERGEPLEPHFHECADCVKARGQYERLTSTIGQLDNNLEPSADWQRRVMRNIEGSTPTRNPRTRWWIGGTALAASAMLATWLLNATQSPAGALTQQLFDSDVVYRGVNAKPGDALQLRADINHADYAELRVYLDDKTLVVVCGDAAQCVRDAGGITARTTLVARGTYRAVLVISDRLIPPAQGALDADVLAAREAGSQVIVGESIDVR